MTWKEFKDAVEKLGILDGDTLAFIESDCYRVEDIQITNDPHGDKRIH
ncbi:MAG: hypothetical protein KAR06_11130 [Deltaproteobacteria bacterium]|nr:hypothetical protein [Deltaproteobacteria bacterium]